MKVPQRLTPYKAEFDMLAEKTIQGTITEDENRQFERNPIYLMVAAAHMTYEEFFWNICDNKIKELVAGVAVQLGPYIVQQRKVDGFFYPHVAGIEFNVHTLTPSSLKIPPNANPELKALFAALEVHIILHNMAQLFEIKRHSRQANSTILKLRQYLENRIKNGRV